MLARSLTVVLVATAAAVAWPISFFPTQDCRSEPVAVLHEPPTPGVCGFFHHEDTIKSYSGGTGDQIEKLLLYYDEELCANDAAHRVHNNHTINNSRNECIPFKKSNEIPRAFTFIKEYLNVPTHNATVSCTNKLLVQ